MGIQALLRDLCLSAGVYFRVFLRAEGSAMRLVILSDTHGQRPEIPDGDVLIHCGDISTHGSRDDIQAGLEWLDKQGHSVKFYVPGNHDIAMQFTNMPWFRSITVLQDREIVYAGVTFYGTPWCPAYKGWGFGIEPGSRTMKAARDAIPGYTDVLISHCPPYGVMDKVKGEDEHLGCRVLRRRVDSFRPRVHCFGHIHTGGEGSPQVNISGTLFVNAAVLDEEYRPVGVPQVVSL